MNKLCANNPVGITEESSAFASLKYDKWPRQGAVRGSTGTVSAVGEHCRFNVTYHKDKNKEVDTTVTVCKHCVTCVTYAINTSSIMI